MVWFMGWLIDILSQGLHGTEKGKEEGLSPRKTLVTMELMYIHIHIHITAGVYRLSVLQRIIVISHHPKH